MKLLALNCNQCGAPLEVPDRANFVTCNFCSTRLSIQKTDKVVFTEAIGEIQERTRDIASDVAFLRMQSQLAELDRQWVIRRDSFMTPDADGQMRLVGKKTAIAAGIVAVVMGFGLSFAIATSSESPGFALIPPVFTLFVLFTAKMTYRRADRFENEQLDYRRARQALLDSVAA
tara:strand:- start:3541 stop:4062 length:522 start_codon:yes stop_codon:yes gene_type:complete